MAGGRGRGIGEGTGPRVDCHPALGGGGATAVAQRVPVGVGCGHRPGDHTRAGAGRAHRGPGHRNGVGRRDRHRDSSACRCPRTVGDRDRHRVGGGRRHRSGPSGGMAGRGRRDVGEHSGRGDGHRALGGRRRPVGQGVAVGISCLHGAGHRTGGGGRGSQHHTRDHRCVARRGGRSDLLAG